MATPTLVRFAAASRLFAANAATLVPVTLLAHGPSFAVQISGERATTGRLLFAGLLDWTIALALSAVLARTVGGSKDLFGAWTAVRPNLARLWGTAFLTALAIMAGSLMFVVPGLLAVALLGPGTALAAHEGAAPLEAMERSASAVRANFVGLGVPLLAGVLATGLLPVIVIAVAGDQLQGTAAVLAMSALNAVMTAWLACLIATTAAAVGPRQDGRIL